MRPFLAVLSLGGRSARAEGSASTLHGGKVLRASRDEISVPVVESSSSCIDARPVPGPSKGVGYKMEVMSKVGMMFRRRERMQGCEILSPKGKRGVCVSVCVCLVPGGKTWCRKSPSSAARIRTRISPKITGTWFKESGETTWTADSPHEAIGTKSR